MATTTVSRVIQTNHEKNGARASLPKTPTGIEGLDEITHGGLPRGRPTLICGNAGCGKTLLGAEFLVRGKKWCAFQHRWDFRL